MEWGDDLGDPRRDERSLSVPVNSSQHSDGPGEG